MRQTLMLATMAVLAACSPNGNTPWDQNHDGLIFACEGLNPQACDATAGCQREPTVCTMDCRDDGHGGCVPCTAVDLCRPTQAPVPPVSGCGNLPPSLCALVPMCELVQETVCSGTAAPLDPTVPGCATQDECQTISTCVNRQPVQCESLTTDACLAHPGCALEDSGTVCALACTRDGVCPPCAAPQQRCVTAPPPDVCGSRDISACALDGRCVVDQGPACDALCDPNGVCPPCAMQQRCVAAPPVDLCGSRDISTCAMDGRCVVDQGATCDVVCDPDGNCPPCAMQQRCVAAPPPDVCGSRDENTCSMDGRCMLEPGPLCLCSPDGVCPPCANPSQRCVPVPPVDVCAGRDPGSCEADGRCVIQPWACAAVCQDDGLGGCLPCAAPPPLCVPAPSRCEGLDRASCSAAGCTVMQLGVACTTACRDDGHGGCLPCQDFVCVDGSTSGGGTAPPSPRP